MTIVFLCGCLEPGRDGVGDYARRLAIELAQQGHKSYAISLNDSYITEAIAAAQPVDDTSLAVLRLPATWPESRRFERARQHIAELQPDWLSLQFVPFSFHPKGLPVSLGKQLVRLGQGCSWHIMFHELWVGMDTAASTKYKWWGRVQRYLISRLLTKVQPKVIHTQTILYQAQLQKMGFSSHYLPLFANISNNTTSVANISIPNNQSVAKAVRLVVFGTIHTNTPIQQLAHDAALYARTHDISVTLTLLGRCGSEQAHWASIWQSAGLPVEILGEQEPNRISEVLLSATMGIATTPAMLLGKSGTTAAMHEHGLHVMCVAPTWQPRGITISEMAPGTVIYSAGNFESCLAYNSPLPINRLTTIAQQLTSDLIKS